MTVRLTPGQNAPLAQRVLRFAVSGDPQPAELDVAAIVVAENLTAASSDDFVFYNQPDTAGVRLRSDGIHVDLDAIQAHARGVLCLFSIDTAVRSARGRCTVDAALFDPAGTVVADFAIPWDEPGGAVICFELYRRADQWKVRAVGQGYSGGLVQLLGVHGIEVDDAGAGDKCSPSVVEPLDPNYPLERIAMIFEDAARSTAALLSARDHATRRLDEELSAAVADPGARTGPVAQTARAIAQRRHDDLVEDAQHRYDADASQLIGELSVIDHELPRSLASWHSSSWRSASSTALRGDGIRLGQVRAAAGDRLTMPFCVPVPLRRPLWVDTSSSVAAAPVVAALVLRLLAVNSMPPPILDVVDLTGALHDLTGRLAPLMDGEPVRSHHDVSAKLAALVDVVDLEVLRAQSGSTGTDLPARVVVLSDFGHGLEVDDLALVATLATRGAAARVSLVIVGSDESEASDPLLRDISQFCEHVPVSADARVRDVWTGNEWLFTPDSVSASGDPMTQLLSSFIVP